MNGNQRILLVLACIAAGLPARSDGDPRGNVAKGKILYQRYCVSCHGPAGNGGGEVAPWLTPKPRDYRQGTFKWRSTPSGSLPLASDLERTIAKGVYGTAMPAWSAIGPRARRDIVAYIETFSPRWTTEHAPTRVRIPPETPDGPASVERGKAVYARSGCASCHGDGGQGDGPSSHALRDDWGDPILPADLTRGHLKSGDRAEDIYRVLVTGMNGSPMPSFADSMSADETWDLVHFIRSLSPVYRAAR